MSPCHRHLAHGRFLLLRPLRDHRLRGHQQASDRSRILQRGAHDLSRVNDAGRYQVLELAGLGVVAPVVLVPIENFPAITAPSSPAFSAI